MRSPALQPADIQSWILDRSILGHKPRRRQTQCGAVGMTAQL